MVLKYAATEPLAQLEAIFAATATAFALRRGGFDDLWAAVLDQNFNGVSLQFRGERGYLGRLSPNQISN